LAVFECIENASPFLFSLFFWLSRENYRRSSLFDELEEGIGRPSSSSLEISEQENDRALDGLQDKVDILKRVIASPRHCVPCFL
jgi:hypothetical protein